MPVVKMILTLKLSMVIVMTMAWRKIEAMVATSEHDDCNDTE